MMLILLITSLMLASGVAVVSKKHVKVPKISVHGSYMCYYKNGRLHEEQYVGPGLTKKIMDRDTNRCEFTPPDRAGYLYFQATAGGGGGGDSGYQGGNLQVFQSATEVITLFGLTQGILDLKGISTGELSSLGGTIYAFANATGGKSNRDPRGGNDLKFPGGDAGNGGDVYYIKKDTNPICLKYREWDYQGDKEILPASQSCNKCVNQKYYKYHYNYTAWDDCCKGGWTTCTDSYWNGWWGDSCSEGYTQSGYWCEKSYSCWSDCASTYVCHKTTGSCTEYSLPTSTATDKTENLYVHAHDIYTGNYTKINSTPPPERFEKRSDATGKAEKVMRNVLRDRQDQYSICNYGNTSKFTGVSDGIFGAFFIGKDSVLSDCSTWSVRSGFGDDIYPLGGGTTSISRVELLSASAVYSKEVKYDTSEENDTAYGSLCFRDANPAFKMPNAMPTYNPNGNGAIPDCGDDLENDIPEGSDDTYSNVPGFRHTPKKDLVTDFNVSVSSESKSNCPTNYDHVSKSLQSTSTHYEPVYDYKKCCTKTRTNSSGKECLYEYTPPADYIAYYPERAIGGTGGTGKSCATNPIKAQLGIKYVGKSSVIAGIRGSDKNCTGAGYKYLYKESEWSSQPGNCYAENGTDSKGSAMVNLNGMTCTVNVTPPTKGKGARKVGAGASGGTNGDSATVSEGTTIIGANTTENATGCADEHVGYCVKGNPYYKYSYKYTWNTNYLQYGEGGRAGSYNVKLIRSIKDGTFVISPGRGGAGGAVGTGNSGDDGENTVVQFMPADGSAGQQILFAAGGAGGPGGLVTPTEQLPTWYSGGDFTAGENGTPGETISIANMKSNIMNLVLPTGDNNVLNQWLLASGAGGDGGGSRNYCWASEWQRWFEGTRVKGNLNMYLDENDMRTYACRQGTYWDSTPAAQDGIAGVVIIRW